MPLGGGGGRGVGRGGGGGRGALDGEGWLHLGGLGFIWFQRSLGFWFMGLGGLRFF